MWFFSQCWSHSKAKNPSSEIPPVNTKTLIEPINVKNAPIDKPLSLGRSASTLDSPQSDSQKALNHHKLPEDKAFSSKLQNIFQMESSSGVHIGSHRCSPTAFKGWIAVKRMQGAGSMWEKRFAVIRQDSSSMFLYESDPVLALLRFYITVPVLKRVGLQGATAKRANVDDLTGCPTQHVRPLGLEVTAASGRMIYGLVCAGDFPDAWLKAIATSAAQTVQPLKKRVVHLQHLLPQLGPPPSPQSSPHHTMSREPNAILVDADAEGGGGQLLLRTRCLLRRHTRAWGLHTLSVQPDARVLLATAGNNNSVIDLSGVQVSATCKEAAFADMPAVSIFDRRLGSTSLVTIMFPSHTSRLSW